MTFWERRETTVGPPSGTRGRFEQLVLPHLDAAHNLARWLMRDPAHAEDVVQDAFLRALTYFQSFRGDDARAWLLQIVRNTAYSALRAKRVQDLPLAQTEGDGGEAIEVADGAPDPEMAACQQEAIARLDAAVAALPDELRECVVLRELEELSYKEIGRITGVPIGTVMSRLWRARQALLRSGVA